MILIDSNVFMYAAGAEHAHKKPSARFLQRVAEGSVEGVVDAEVLQEILDRYRAIRRWKEGRLVFDYARRITPLVIAITSDILDNARALLDGFEHVAVRDAVHAAVVTAGQADAICSYDRDFDAIAGVSRIQP